ncbi:hypothetical protein [Nocardia tenerifensis]|uniref:hypothetical protein n=1 Tax=Nocardia tenerifensis TaxID=228006 RepID=UPI0002DF3F01|nr:hypothetical protein [Nocardia tenerifensis]
MLQKLEEINDCETTQQSVSWGAWFTRQAPGSNASAGRAPAARRFDIRGEQ